MVAPAKKYPASILTFVFWLAGSAAAKRMPVFYDKVVGDWIYCGVNSDCIVIRGPCGEPECVNITNSAMASAYYEELKASLNPTVCDSRGKELKVRSVCEENQCQCKPLQKGKSGQTRNPRTAAGTVNRR